MGIELTVLFNTTFLITNLNRIERRRQVSWQIQLITIVFGHLLNLWYNKHYALLILITQSTFVQLAENRWPC